MRLLEVTLRNPNDFLKVAETLRRIGHADVPNMVLKQSVFVLHKTGKYFLLHHTELETLDKSLQEVPESGIAVRNTIANLLENWNLVSITKPEWATAPRASMKDIMVVPFKDRDQWQMHPLYEIGKVKS